MRHVFRLLTVMALFWTAGCSTAADPATTGEPASELEPASERKAASELESGLELSTVPMQAELQRCLLDFMKQSDPELSDEAAWNIAQPAFEKYMGEVRRLAMWSEFVPESERKGSPSPEYAQIGQPDQQDKLLADLLKVMGDFGKSMPPWLENAVKDREALSTLPPERKRLVINALVIEMLRLQEDLS